MPPPKKSVFRVTISNKMDQEGPRTELDSETTFSQSQLPGYLIPWGINRHLAKGAHSPKEHGPLQTVSSFLFSDQIRLCFQALVRCGSGGGGEHRDSGGCLHKAKLKGAPHSPSPRPAEQKPWVDRSFLERSSLSLLSTGHGTHLPSSHRSRCHCPTGLWPGEN